MSHYLTLLLGSCFRREVIYQCVLMLRSRTSCQAKTEGGHDDDDDDDQASEIRLLRCDWGALLLLLLLFLECSSLSLLFSDSMTRAIKNAHMPITSSLMATRMGASPGGVAMLR